MPSSLALDSKIQIEIYTSQINLTSISTPTQKHTYTYTEIVHTYTYTESHTYTYTEIVHQNYTTNISIYIKAQYH